MLLKIRKSKFVRVFAIYIVINFLAGTFSSGYLRVKAGGPLQPEYIGSSYSGGNDMVDLFTGDFHYSIPLMEIDGYPIIIKYNSGVTMSQEASWVGLGWTLNPGSVTRDMRGIPDDFNGDVVNNELNIKPNETVGVKISAFKEFLGKAGSIGGNLGLGIFKNSYTGFGVEKMTSVNGGLMCGNKLKKGGNLCLGINSSTTGGATAYGNLSVSVSKSGQGFYAGAGGGMSYNARSGVKSFSLGLSGGYNKEKDKKNGDGKEYEGVGIGTGGTITFGTPTTFPISNISMDNCSKEFSIKIGYSNNVTDRGGELSGYYSCQEMAKGEDVKNLKTYGYKYLQNSSIDGKSLMDFNREKNGIVSSNTPSLPLTNLTYDLFSVSAYGLNSTIRPYRADIGTVYDNTSNDNSKSLDIGFEGSFGNIVKVGANPTFINVKSRSGGIWDLKNIYQMGGNLYSKLFFISFPLYFKEPGTITENNNYPQYESNLGKALPSLFDISGTSYSRKMYPSISTSTESPDDITTSLQYSNFNGFEKLKSARYYEMLTREESKSKLKGEFTNSYEFNNNPDHFGSLLVTNEQGDKYIFGQPVYNNEQTEELFSINGNNEADDNGFCSYSSVEKSRGNTSGSDHYYSKHKVPGYSSEILITSVLSKDYVDLTSNGPTPDDFGNYTIFTYEKSPGSYNWCIPITNKGGKADFIEGLRGLKQDNKASLTYGNREQYYLKTIKTKNYIAVFETEDRYDCYGTTPSGIDGNSKSKKLKSISLYNREEYEKNQSINPPVTTVPVKVVHFVYDYSLCSGVFDNINVSQNNNNDRGKLTLKEIYFTYGNSAKARYNSYKFKYGNNKNYNPKGYDMWGTYRDVATSNYKWQYDEYYTDQDKKTADNNVQAWTLNEIYLPTGGKIKIDYESDDYAYVQDNPVANMFQIIGVGSVGGESLNAEETDGRSKIFFKIPKSYNFNIGDFKKILLNNSNNGVYFRCLTQVIPGSNVDKYEFVTSYLDIYDGNYDLDTSDKDYNTGSFEINVNLKNENTLHPITKAAIQLLKNSMPQVAYNKGSFTEPNPDDKRFINNVVEIAKGIVDMGSFLELFKGAYENFHKLGVGQKIDLNHSFVRLYNPVGKKYGGGSRVKKIKFYDNWDQMTSTGSGNAENSYTSCKTYKYTIDDNRLKKEISSGVTSYEPQLGGDENSLKKPIYFGTETPYHDIVFYEEPYGESFYPAPSVGYRKVTEIDSVMDKNGDMINIAASHKTGRTEYEFYTYKDYPIRAGRSTLVSYHDKSGGIESLLNIGGKDFLTHSQGFYVTINDMHGKPKSIKQFGEGDNISQTSVEYFYKDNGTTDNNGNHLQGNKLINDIQVINPDGSVIKKKAGIEYDIVNDVRQDITSNQVISTGLNVSIFAFFIPPVLGLPFIRFQCPHEQTEYRSVALTKVIRQYGILDEVKSTNHGSVVSTKNLAYDKITGEVLLKQVNNEYNDPVYMFQYPAYWAYSGMGPKDVLQTNKNMLTNKAGSIVCLNNPISNDKLNISVDNQIIDAEVETYKDSWQTMCDCISQNQDCSTMKSNGLTGGMWRPFENYSYFTNRNITRQNNNTYTRKDGTFKTFESYWKYDANSNSLLPSVSDNVKNWKAVSTIVKYSPSGSVLEQHDAKYNYSSQQIGYNKKYKTASAINAKYKETGYDGFEDYDLNVCNSSTGHFDWREYFNNTNTTGTPLKYSDNTGIITNDQSHTGKRSIKVAGGSSLIINRTVE